MWHLLILVLLTTSEISGQFSWDSFLRTPSKNRTDFDSSLVPVTLTKGEKLVLNCGRAGKNVKWRKNNVAINKLNLEKLVIPRVSLKDAGKYSCAVGNKTLNTFFVNVLPKSYFTDSFKNNVITTGLPATTVPVPTAFPLEFFECNDGGRVNISLKCDHKVDCKDGSDEKKCEFFHPKITKLPESEVKLLCGTDKSLISDTLILNCEFSGHPEPIVKWKRYGGHVPSKCRQTSTKGYGTLICHNFHQSDQGAYACVGENSEGSGQSQPKSIVKCRNYIHCAGFKVLDEDQIEHCLDCFCSGKSNQCENIKSKPLFTDITLPDSKTEVFAKNNGEIVFVPSKLQLRPDLKTEKDSTPITYCELSADDIQDTSLLKSYGRKLRIPKLMKNKEKLKFFRQAPDLIIKGSNLTLLYDFNYLPDNIDFIDIKFWQGNWVHLNKTHATRKDIMTVLSDFEGILIRCEYKEGIIENTNRTIKVTLETSSITNSSSSSGFMEKCNCPKGYAGLSCEICAEGYERITTGKDFLCKSKTCNEANGYYWDGKDCKKSICNIYGSLSLKPDSSGKCKCKENVIGEHCDKCKNGYFNVQGCLKCFCSGVSEICNSTTFRRTLQVSSVIGGYNASSNIFTNDKNFWLLPSVFTGNRLTSYGGDLKYEMKYTPNLKKQTSLLSVELLTGEDFTLTYTHPDVDTSTVNNIKVWKVPLTEIYWKKADNTVASRNEFLTVLSNLKAIYIESPYHLANKMVNLTYVHMSDAKNISDIGSEIAYEVEQCQCPPGYKGLSCEQCEEGYVKMKNSNICMLCDPQKGCSECPKGQYRSNPETEKFPVCKKCNCNGNEEKCGVDIDNKFYCICKSGYGGFNCENKIAVNDSHLILRISPSKLSLSQLGSMVTFNCSYDSSDEMDLSFTKVYSKGTKGPFIEPLNPLPSTASKFGYAMIWHTHADKDLVQVECKVNNKKKKEVGKVVAIVDKIDTAVPVKINNCFSDTITVKETKSQDLICEATGRPAPKITWSIKLANGSEEILDTVDGVHSIKNAKLEQNGTKFICQAKNEIKDIDTCTVTLLVTKNCDQVHVIPKTLTITEGETISLKCTVNTNSSVSWSGLNFLLPVHRKEKDGILTIENATTRNTGYYVCKAWSNGEYINNTVNVTVIEKKIPPTAFISKDDVDLKFGDNFEVDCTATGKPTPTVSWIKVPSLNNVIINKGNLKINKATLENTGIYECQANSSESTHVPHISRLYVNVTDNRVKPKIVTEPAQEWAIEGTRVTLKCSIKEGIPHPSLYWSKYVAGKVLSVKPNGIVQENGTILVFENISRNDTANYVCTAKNEMGQDESKTEIIVMYKPEITVSEEEISAIENENITVTCTGTGLPVPDLVWENRKKSYKKRNSGLNNQIANMKSINQISITVKAEKDLEALICIGKNRAGTTTKEVKIKILPLSEPFSEHALKVPLGSFHEIKCYNCSGKLTWDTSKGPLIGDECEIKDGLKIESVQIQHNRTYICKCDTDPQFSKRFTLIVGGYAPQFSQKTKSYLIVPASFEPKKQLRLELSFKTNEKDGMLLYHENKFLIYIHNGKIVVILFSGSATKSFSSDERLSTGIFYSLVVDISTSKADLTIYNEDADVVERKTENFFGFKFEMDPLANIYVGGMKHVDTNHHYIRHSLSLDGCITRLNINNHEFDIVKEGNYSSMVSLCSRCSSIENPCRGKGKCLDAPTHFGYVCVCPESSTIKSRDTCPGACKGRNCEGQFDLCKLLKPCNKSNSRDCSANSLRSLECYCESGFSGPTCSDEKVNTICFGGDGYAKLSSTHLSRQNLIEPERISMDFITKTPNGLLLLQGDNENRISISVTERKLKYLFINQNIKLEIISDQISLDNMHTLKIKKSNGSVILDLDSKSYNRQVKFKTNRIYGHIYLGGVPRYNYHYKQHKGFTGEIYSVSFGTESKINFRKNALEIVNEKPCENYESPKSKAEYEGSGNPLDYDAEYIDDFKNSRKFWSF